MHADLAGVKPYDGDATIVGKSDGDFQNDRAGITSVDCCPTEIADDTMTKQTEHRKRHSRTFSPAKCADKFSEPTAGCSVTGAARMTFRNSCRRKSDKSDVFLASARRPHEDDEDGMAFVEENGACDTLNAEAEKTGDEAALSNDETCASADVDELPAAEYVEPCPEVTDVYVDQSGYVVTEDDLDSVVVIEISD
jgi:hypothetical protein